jgi:hypothetical protein
MTLAFKQVPQLFYSGSKCRVKEHPFDEIIFQKMQQAKSPLSNSQLSPNQ